MGRVFLGEQPKFRRRTALGFRNLLLHLGDLAVDALQVEAQGAAVGCSSGLSERQ